MQRYGMENANRDSHLHARWNGFSAPDPIPWASNSLSVQSARLEAVLCKANPTSGGVTASTEMLAAKRHAGVHTPVIACKMIIANQQMAYAA